jgi:hypothetical protein
MFNNSSSPTLNNCTFSGNSSAVYGGGMSDSQAASALNNCTFSGNSAIYGGGIDIVLGATSLINCTFIRNRADYGGVIFTGETCFLLGLTNCTFAKNSATFGNALACNGIGAYGPAPSGLRFTNCVFWDGGDEIWNNDGSTITIVYSDVQGGWPGPGGNNIDADPCFVDAAGGDLRLSWDSPCIDTGDNNAPNLPPTDLDGHPRIIDGDCNGSEVVDMGAFEFNSAYIGDFDFSCTVDFADLSIFGLAWTSQPDDFNWDVACDISIPADNVIDKLDLAAFADNWLAGF